MIDHAGVDLMNLMLLVDTFTFNSISPFIQEAFYIQTQSTEFSQSNYALKTASLELACLQAIHQWVLIRDHCYELARSPCEPIIRPFSV
jgi:hypothetical protein